MTRLMRRTGLRFRFVLAVSLLLVMSLGATALYVTNAQEHLLLSSLDAKARSLGKFVALISPQAVYAYDITSLDRFVQQVSSDPDVHFVIIRNPSGAALTTYLSLAGRYCVFVPNTTRGGGVSRKITNAADRKRLKTIMSELNGPRGSAIILRTAGSERTASGAPVATTRP